MSKSAKKSVSKMPKSAKTQPPKPVKASAPKPKFKAAAKKAALVQKPKATKSKSVAPAVAPETVVDTTAEVIEAVVVRADKLAPALAPTVHVELPEREAVRSDVEVTVKSRRDGALMDAHRQWAQRPADEAVYSFEELLTRTEKARTSSQELAPQKWSDLHVEVRGDELALVGPTGGALLSNWTANRVANIASAPAEYIQRLPAQLAADCLNHGLEGQKRRVGTTEMLVTNGRIRALTSERYERVWDHEIATLANELHTRGTWGACEAFRSASAETVSHAWGEKKALPLGWVGDRSSFIALADYEGAIKVNGTKLARFALLSNSEVGAASFKIVFGLMDFACANFILWGCQQVTEVSVRHTGNIRERFQALTAPMTTKLSLGQRNDVATVMQAASKVLIADTQPLVLERVASVTKLPKPMITDAWARAEATPRYGDPRSVWGMLSGLTEASQHVAEHTDKRILLDEQASRLMQLVA